MKSDLTFNDFKKFEQNDFKFSFWIQYFSFKRTLEEKDWVNSLTENMIIKFSEKKNSKRLFIDCKTILLNLVNSILLDGK